MKPAPFHYHAPATIDECVQLLSQYGDDAAVLAGGQSLVPLMRFRLAQPAHVISIRNIKEGLDTIRSSNDGVSVGACVTYIAVQNSQEVAAACPLLPQAIDLVAHPAVRTRGTICGNLCQADPASELPAVALLMEATFKLRSTAGERIVKAADFFQGPYTTARQSDELLVEVTFPRRPASEKFAIKEVTRLRGGFPMAGIALATNGGTSEKPQSVALACFGVNSHQVRLDSAEKQLVELGFTARGIDAAAKAIGEAIHPHADPFASEDYRRAATLTLFRRAISEMNLGGHNQ